jgi:exosortase A
MPPERGLPGRYAPRRFTLTAAWRTGLVRLMLGWLMLVGLFHAQWREMADQWWNISTYSHVLLVPAIVAWLVMLHAPALAPLRPRAGRLGIGLFVAALALWLAGSMAGLALAQQAGAVGMLAASVPALLGADVARALRFPLAYMAFLVPFGDELIPTLQAIDARLTVWLLHATQVPARLDGVFITPPAGLFEIAQACSGIKFLIAMIAFGVLAAHVCFVSWRRRAVFLAACVVVPILANAVRSWATIYVAQWVGAEKAGGFDHLVYGWIFFALVIASTLAMSWRWFDRPVGEPLASVVSAPSRIDGRGLPGWPVLAALLLMALGAQAWARTADSLLAPLPPTITLPQVPGWTLSVVNAGDSAPAPHWEPLAGGSNGRVLGRYTDAAGHRVEVFAAIYASQGPGRKADGWGQGAWTPYSGWDWQGSGAAPADARGDRLRARGGIERLAQTSYRHGALLTGSGVRLRLAVIADRLMVHARPTTVVILSARVLPGAPATQSLAAFRAATGPLGDWADKLLGGRTGVQQGN